MFKHSVTYVDFNGAPHNEDLYFNLMTPEIADLEFNPMFGGSLGDYIREGMKSGQGQRIYTVFKMLVVNSYGRRSEDGARFSKKPEWTEEFLNSPAWEQFFLWLTEKEDGSNGQAFYTGIVPPALQAQAEVMAKQSSASGQKSLTELSQAELIALLEKKQLPNNTNTIEG